MLLLKVLAGGGGQRVVCVSSVLTCWPCLCVLQEWATVLASPDVLRVADACSTAEDAALGAALTGKGVAYVNKAIDVCRAGLHEWEHGIVQVSQGFTSVQRALSPGAHTMGHTR